MCYSERKFMKPARHWDVLLIGGASGSGKTHLSYPIAQHFGIGLTEVDDFQVILERMTTPEQQPILHFWRTHPDAGDLPVADIVAQSIAVANTMRPALEAVIANHLESDTPVVLEGDFILPMLAAQPNFDGVTNGGRVRGLFIDEPDLDRLIANYREREPAAGEQIKRAQVSRDYGAWLKAEALRVGATVLPARPWQTGLERALRMLV
jgi:2-phosphoglycerate kinase